MRLTLRTLLAYLDQILDEQDAEELEQKIHESELATQLVHRIRAVMGQRRIAALDVDADGLGRDTNSVAEYLDNTLPAEQIPDFERVCLESDVHLSEVAACHQILTLVLGEPAAIPDGLKEKIYRLPQELAAHASPATQPTPSPPLQDAGTQDRRPAADDEVLHALLGGDAARPLADIKAITPTAPVSGTDSRATWDEDEHWTEAPDYLKRPRPGRWKPVAIVTLIAFCLAMAALRGMGRLDRNHPLAQRFGLFEAPPTASAGDPTRQEANPPTEEAEAEAEAPDAGTAGGQPPREQATTSDDEAPASAPAALATETPSVPRGNEQAVDFPNDVPDQVDLPPANGADEVPSAVPPPSAGPLTGNDEAPANTKPLELEPVVGAPQPDEQPTEPSSPSDLDLAADQDRSSPIDGALELNQPGSDEPAGPVATSDDDIPATPTLVNPLATNRSEVRPSDLSIPPVPGPANEAPTTDSAVDEGPELTSPPVVPQPRTLDIGRFLDTQQVLVKWDPTDELWQRVEAGTRLHAGDILMSLPTYRSPLVLTSGMQVNLIGGTRVEVLEPDAEATPFFRLEFGQLTVATFAQAGITFGLDWAPDHSGVLTLADMNTTLAVQLKPAYLPGANPEETPQHQVLHIYVTSGSAEWTADQGPTIKISVGQRLTLVDDYPALLKDATQQPEWIDGRDARPRDPIAARDLSERLTPDRPVTLVLKEEADSRRFEVRSLAVCSLAYLGDFDPLFVALNDAKLRVYWPAQYEVLEQVPSFAPEFMASCKKTILQRHGEEEGQQLYRMLWGYSPEQLADGSAAELFDYLDHPSIDFRIVASEELKSITGQPSLYRANASERDPQRHAAISRWRKMLDNGEIVYQRPPELVELLNEVAPEP